MSLLEIQDLKKAFGGVRAVRGVSFGVNLAEAVAIIGPNGAGKTTCFNLIGGQLRPDSGRVLYDGQDVTGMTTHRLWRLGVGRTFQITAVLGSMTVVENVQMALISHRQRTRAVFSSAARMFGDEARNLLERVGLADQAGRSCATLAFGDLKRLELAVALANDPKLLLLDEPTAGVAAGERSALMSLIAETVRVREISVLFTEHDMDVVFGYADRVIVLHRGELVVDSTPEEVRADRHVQEIYLGTVDESEGLVGRTRC